MFCLQVCMWTTFVPGTHGGQKASNPFGWELQLWATMLVLVGPHFFEIGTHVTQAMQWKRTFKFFCECSICRYTCMPEEGISSHYKWLWALLQSHLCSLTLSILHLSAFTSRVLGLQVCFTSSGFAVFKCKWVVAVQYTVNSTTWILDLHSLFFFFLFVSWGSNPRPCTS